ncbi:MAG: hypothetical protein A2805_02055 [Candidatus Andersenbacteria bacterium RIFCSPHIGHO2_01_FULL_46_36]|nr:MAG: hypothetical protein A2805_02055 [Candidatus Andersenbacteria bacterium RIFCSPHIGHO2_01_FULL_46_36]QBM02285.1 hypothetical protein [uncultured archaeon]
MIGVIPFLAALVGCTLLQQPFPSCVPYALTQDEAVPVVQKVPRKTGESIDVVLSAQAALVWDIDTKTILYDKNGTTQRPIASLNKLLSALAVRELLPSSETIVEIPPDVRAAQRAGANIKLPVGQHATVEELLAASMIPSANDAIVALAVASKKSEAAFATYANDYAARHGLFHTKLANATGLQGGDQYSTAHDVMKMLTLAYKDPVLKPYLSQKKGVLTTQEGTVRTYDSTDELIGTYLPILAGKTGYTIQAKENLAILTVGPNGQKIGAVILGSNNRFQDMKTVVEWIWRNYTWP